MAGNLLLLDGKQVAALLDPDDVFAAVQESLARHASGTATLFPVLREGLRSGAVFGIKGGTIDSAGLLGFKAAGFWPGNAATGHDRHQATVVLMDPDSGRPLCILDGNAITTARTGAAGGIGIALLARADVESACVFGTGVQAVSQIDWALRVRPSLRTVRYQTSDHRIRPDFEARFAGRCRVVHTTDANQAVAASDLVITATRGVGPLFDAEAVRPGTHLNAVGADTRGKRELPAGLLARATVFVDDLAQSRAIGELQWAPDQAAEMIGSALDRASARKHMDEITLFDMTGIAFQDLTVASAVVARADRIGAGTRLRWPW